MNQKNDSTKSIKTQILFATEIELLELRAEVTASACCPACHELLPFMPALYQANAWWQLFSKNKQENKKGVWKRKISYLTLT